MEALLKRITLRRSWEGVRLSSRWCHNRNNLLICPCFEKRAGLTNWAASWSYSWGKQMLHRVLCALSRYVVHASAHQSKHCSLLGVCSIQCTSLSFAIDELPSHPFGIALRRKTREKYQWCIFIQSRMGLSGLGHKFRNALHGIFRLFYSLPLLLPS